MKIKIKKKGEKKNKYLLTNANKKDFEKDEFSIIDEEVYNIKNQIRKINTNIFHERKD